MKRILIAGATAAVVASVGTVTHFNSQPAAASQVSDPAAQEMSAFSHPAKYDVTSTEADRFVHVLDGAPAGQAEIIGKPDVSRARKLLVDVAQGVSITAAPTSTGQVCEFETYRDGNWGGGCIDTLSTTPNASVVRLTESTPFQVTGLLPDGVTQVDVVNTEGETSKASIEGNAYAWTASTVGEKPASVVEHLAGGKVLKKDLGSLTSPE